MRVRRVVTATTYFRQTSVLGAIRTLRPTVRAMAVLYVLLEVTI